MSTSTSVAVPEGIDPRLVTWAETIAGGSYASHSLARGTTLRLIDRDGNGCVHVLLFNSSQPTEHLSATETVTIPGQTYLGPAHPLLSGQGRVLATIVGDYVNGASDALCGCSTRAHNDARYGNGSADGPTPAGEELLIQAARQYGLDSYEMPTSVSFFKRVRVNEDGMLNYTGSRYTGGHIDLRAELPLIALIANAPHPLDPRPDYTCSPVDVLAWRGQPTAPTDPLWSFSPELEHAYVNTADYVDARGLEAA